MSIPTEASQAGDAQPGVTLSSYELLGKLARGGMGTVYVARRAGAAGFQRLFAIKLMHEHLADHEEFVQMFLDEARLAARLHHPNVVAIVDVGEVDGRQFVVMDYIEGCSLGQLFKLSPERRPVESVASIFNDFLLGLHAAHELTDDNGSPLNLVHRDVSPQNILVGLDGVARITDFGIAKAEARLTSTRPGLRKGKLAFMAPEQLYDKELDRRADIFAAGAIFWSALTGEKLFSGSSDAATMRNLLQMEIKPPSQVGLKPPPVFDAVVAKALQRDPDDRFSTASDMVDALRQAAMDGGVLGTSSNVSKWIKAVAGPKIEDRRKALGGAAPPGADSSIRTIPVLVESPSRMHSSLSELSGLSRASAVPVGAPNRGRGMLWGLLLIPAAAVLAVLLAVMTHDEGTEGDPRRRGDGARETSAAAAPPPTATEEQAPAAASPAAPAPTDEPGTSSVPGRRAPQTIADVAAERQAPESEPVVDEPPAAAQPPVRRPVRRLAPPRQRAAAADNPPPEESTMVEPEPTMAATMVAAEEQADSEPTFNDPERNPYVRGR